MKRLSDAVCPDERLQVCSSLTPLTVALFMKLMQSSPQARTDVRPKLQYRYITSMKKV